MKIEQEHDSKFQTTLENKTAFTIKATAKSFAILSSNLYKNAIRAGIRELSCNAIDAHIDNKNYSPFEVKLPTVFDLEFHVQDFGIGMTEDELTKVFTTYFDSTKTSDNERIGGIGLGSKSPFAYTSQYTIETSKNGTKTIALAYLDEDRMPNLSILHSGPCDKSGTKVSYAVNPDDIELFHKEAVNVFLTLDMMPKIVAGKTEFYHVVKIISNYNYEEIEHWENHYDLMRQVIKTGIVGVDTDMRKDVKQFINRVIGSNNPCLIMGGVAYPIFISEIFTDESSMSTVAENIFKSEYVIGHAEIGDVSIQPSREALMYDKKTKAFFASIVRNFIHQTVKNCFSGTKTLFEYYHNMQSTIAGKQLFIPLLSKEVCEQKDVDENMRSMFGTEFVQSEADTAFSIINQLREINTEIFKFASSGKGVSLFTKMSRDYQQINVNGMYVHRISIQPCCRKESFSEARNMNPLNDIWEHFADDENNIKLSNATVDFYQSVCHQHDDYSYWQNRTRRIMKLMDSLTRCPEHHQFSFAHSKITTQLYGKNFTIKEGRRYERDDGGARAIYILNPNPAAVAIFEKLGIEHDFTLETLTPLMEFPKMERDAVDVKVKSDKCFYVINGNDNTDKYRSFDSFNKKKNVYYVVVNSAGKPIFYDERMDCKTITLANTELCEDMLDNFTEVENFINNQNLKFGFMEKKLIVKVPYGNWKALKLKDHKHFKNLWREYATHIATHIDEYVNTYDLTTAEDGPSFCMKMNPAYMAKILKKYPEFEATTFYDVWAKFRKNHELGLDRWKLQRYMGSVKSICNNFVQANSLSGLNDKEVIKFVGMVETRRNGQEVNALTQTLFDNYPMLSLCNSYSYNDDQLQAIVDYVLTIENQSVVELKKTA